MNNVKRNGLAFKLRLKKVHSVNTEERKPRDCKHNDHNKKRLCNHDFMVMSLTCVNIANTHVLSLFYTEEGFSQGEVDHLFSALVLANFTCGLPVYDAVDSDLTVICDRVTRPRISLLFVISRNILLFYYFAPNIFALRNFPV